VDEAERLLDTSFRGNNHTKDKAWLNSFLEDKKVSIIWVTNQISHVDQAVRRRFDFSIYFPVLTNAQRMKLWEKVLGKYNATELVSRATLSGINRKFVVPVSVMDRAVEYAKDLSSDKKDFVSMIKTQLESFISFKEDGLDSKKLRHKDKNEHADTNLPQKDYTTDGVNFDCNIDEFITGIKKLDEYVKNTKKPKSGCGTILFYGPSGTGKTELARYIAKLTRRKAVVKKASDLLNCYVGESEKNVAKAFRALNLKKEILVIDEVDSFLYNRSTANESWENTLVNEFLTQLQDFKGILICTTNLKTGLDPAVMRRFSFKLEFRYSEGKQVEALFNSILKPISGKDLSKEELTELLSMKNLTPGDFHVVEDKFCSFFTVSEKTGNKDLLNALKEEQKKKNEQSESHRRIGFI
jgi:SpoVK/Ycf46/Vps4 family AAA+-type ATPase